MAAQRHTHSESGPFGQQAYTEKLGMDMETESVNPMTYLAPDVQAPGQSAPGKNTARTSHGRHPGTPTIGNPAVIQIGGQTGQIGHGSA